MLHIRKIVSIILISGVSCSGWILVLSNILPNITTHKRLYNSTDNIPYNKAGLLLGTSKYIADGRKNLFYLYRIDAAEKLYKAGKIDFILVSGDNAQKEYNEPTTIREDLLERGIPKEHIFLDFAGFRTLDSVVRSKKVFGQESITVISQKFHNRRAIFLARSKGIDAIGYNAQMVSLPEGKKTRFREIFARVKMMLDLIFNKQPKFLGESITIE